jgi:hypothetical protein
MIRLPVKTTLLAQVLIIEGTIKTPACRPLWNILIFHPFSLFLLSLHRLKGSNKLLPKPLKSSFPIIWDIILFLAGDVARRLQPLASPTLSDNGQGGEGREMGTNFVLSTGYSSPERQLIPMAKVDCTSGFVV